MLHETTYDIHFKEQLYFAIKVVVSLVMYAVLGGIIFMGVELGLSHFIPVGVLYIVLIALVLLFRMGYLVGYLRGNAVKVSERQFPDIYDTVQRQSKALGLSKEPDTYILEYGGMLNAFATRFVGRNYVVLFTEIVDEAYEDNKASVDFVIGHELGHIKRNHITKSLLLFPSAIVPFLNAAYSRGCEYTCDSIGAALSPDGAVNGLLLLASGKKLYKKVNVAAFTDQKDTEGGFWAWFAEKISSHPKLTKRVAVFQQQPQRQFTAPVTRKESSFQPEPFKPLQKEPAQPAEAAEDHNKYMPKF